MSPLRKRRTKPNDSLPITSEDQRDDASSGDVGVAGRRIGGRRTVLLGGLTSDDAAQRRCAEEPSGIVSEPWASHGQHDEEEREK
jgi:hypothetical protein